jgi:hypothetical protein
MSKSLPKPTTAPQRPATQYYHGAAFRTAVLEDRSRLEADIRKDMALRERKQRLQEYATQIRVSSPACYGTPPHAFTATIRAHARRGQAR